MKLLSFSLLICSALKSTMHEHVLSPFSVQFFASPWTAALQVPLSMGFSMREYWSGLPCPSPEDPPDPGIEPTSPSLRENSLPLSHRGIGQIPKAI